MFGVSFGTILAFVQPARESLLGYAPPEVMHQAVAKMMVVQFVAQGVGFIVAGQLDYISLPQLLVLQMLIFLASSLLMKRCHPLPQLSSVEEAAQAEKSNKSAAQTWLELARRSESVPQRQKPAAPIIYCLCHRLSGLWCLPGGHAADCPRALQWRCQSLRNAAGGF